MENEVYARNMLIHQSYQCLGHWIKWLRQNNLYGIIIIICEIYYDRFEYHSDFLNELGVAYYYMKEYQHSWDTFQHILSRNKAISEENATDYIFNAHFNIPHILEQYTYPITIEKQIPSLHLITVSITSCKRLDLFQKTMNSFLRCCTDVELVSRWLCVDDNSSDEDRAKMQEEYPFMEFYFKTPAEKGHPQSMNIIMNLVDTPYLFHMEDDWQFFCERPFLNNCLEVLDDNPMYGQCLINRNYGELPEDITLAGGIPKQTSSGLRYYIHEYTTDVASFQQKYPGRLNCAYWPYYSLRPGLNRMSALKSVGLYNTNVGHFEMEFAYRYVSKNYVTTFFQDISCQHIGRLTRDRNDVTKQNAYVLNKEHQFDKPVTVSETVAELPFPTYVVNLESREDRWITCQEALKQISPVTRYSAVNGYKLKATRQLEQLFNDNDYNFRKGMIGCALSHIDLWIKCTKSDTMFMILEDDVTLTKYFGIKLKFVLSTLNDWDILFLGHHLWKHNITDDSYNQQKVPIAEKKSVSEAIQLSMGGTGGYCITPKGAKKMLEFIYTTGMTNGIDTMMQKGADSLDVYYCTPHLIFTDCYRGDVDAIDTDIQCNYDSLKRPIEERLQDEQDYFDSNEIRIDIIHTTDYTLHKDSENIYKVGQGHWIDVIDNVPYGYSLKNDDGEFSLLSIIEYA
jgi:GR25 family glycosyltransferase involved in LPS biosynthesis